MPVKGVRKFEEITGNRSYSTGSGGPSYTPTLSGEVAAPPAPAPDPGTPDRLLYDLAALGYTRGADTILYDVRFRRTASGTAGHISAIADALGRSKPTMASPGSGTDPLLVGTSDADYEIRSVDGSGTYLAGTSDVTLDPSVEDLAVVYCGTVESHFPVAIQQSDFTVGSLLFEANGSVARGQRFPIDDAVAHAPASTSLRRTHVLQSYRNKAASFSVLPGAAGPDSSPPGSSNGHLGTLPTGAYFPQVGRISSGNTGAFRMRFLGTFPGGLNGPQQAVVHAYCTTYHYAVAAPAQRAFTAIGDSITFGVGSTTPATDSWPAKVAARTALAAAGVVFDNIGVNGRYGEAMAADAVAMGKALSDPSGLPRVFAYAGGINDLLLNGKTPTQVAGFANTFIDGILAGGPNNRVVYSPLTDYQPVGGGRPATFDADRTTVENLVTAHVASLPSADQARVFRVAPTVAPWTSGSMDTTLGTPITADGLHPNTAGYALYAAQVGPVMQAALGL